MKAVIAIAALALAGCATTSATLAADKPPLHTYESARAPLDVGRCILARVPGTTIYPGTDLVTVSLHNQFDSILLDWRITPTPKGAHIEVRRTNSLAGGIATAEACF